MNPARLRVPRSLAFVAVTSAVAGCAPSVWVEDIGDGCSRIHSEPDDVVTSISCGIADGCSVYETPTGAPVQTVCPLPDACLSITPTDGASTVSCSGTMQNT